MDDKIFETIFCKIESIRQNKDFILIAIDGRCGSGKTTLAAALQERLKCHVVHMDHFFPRMEQRTAERLNEPGGNLDRERFLEEVILPIKAREAFSYCPYIPWEKRMGEAIQIEPCNVIIAEGSYSCHPELFDNYDLRIFLTVSESERLRRIEKRNGKEKLVEFQEKWIPMEEKYFSAFNVENRCDLWFKTG